MFSPIVGYTLRNGRHTSSGDLTEEDFSIEFSWNHATSTFFFFKTLYLQKKDAEF